MDTTGQMELMPPPEVPYTTYIVVIWVFVTVSGITLICRLVSRFRGPHRLFWDDGLVILPWLLSLVTAATWQWAAKDMYYTMNVQAALAVFNPNTYMISLRNFLNASLIAELFFYTALLSIKLSFLLFFRRLGNGINQFKYIWWPILIITVGSYFGAIGNVDYKCLVGSIEEITGICQQEKELQFIATTLKANAAFDVLTDIMIMLLPTILVWNTQIRWSKKLALIGLFSLSIITIVTAIVRAVMVDSKRRPDGNPDVTWLWFWSAVEPSVAIMVCCGSAFPQLFSSSTRSSKKPQFSPSETYLRMMSRIRSSRKRRNAGDDTTWLDLTAVSQDNPGVFDSYSRTITADEGRGHDADPESGYGGMMVHVNNPNGEPQLVPQGPGPIPAVHTYIGTSSHSSAEGPKNQITRHFEFETK